MWVRIPPGTFRVAGSPRPGVRRSSISTHNGQGQSLLANLRRLQERIDTSLRRRRSGVLRRKLYLELLSVLNGTGQFRAIPKSIPRAATLTHRIYKQVNGASGNALPRAIYASAFYPQSPETREARSHIPRAAWRYVSRLARQLRVEPSFGQAAASPSDWMIDIDEAHQPMRVWIRELAVQDMLLAAMESYLVPDGSGRPSTETYGIVFGSFREAPQTPHAPPQPDSRTRAAPMIDVNVERVCIQHRAKGSPSEVFIDERSEETQLAMGEELFPYWHLLGDFHTHTYRTLPELTQGRGWLYSDYDEKVNIVWCHRLMRAGRRPRVALILAIARAGRATPGARECWNGKPHVLRATIGKCHVFIAAYRILPSGRYSTEAVTLKCPHLVGH